MTFTPYGESLSYISGQHLPGQHQPVSESVRLMRYGRKQLKRITGVDCQYSMMAWHQCLLECKNDAFSADSIVPQKSVSEYYSENGKRDFTRIRQWYKELDANEERQQLIEIALLQDEIQDEIQDRIAKVAEILISHGVATRNTIERCSPPEIEQVEAEVGRPLPLAYREFLARMGCGAGRFYVGTDLFYPRLLGMTAAARELVAEDEADLKLPEDAIAFLMHQGYQFMFLQADEGDDPPVYYYLECSGEFVQKADRLSQFLLDVAYDQW